MEVSILARTALIYNKTNNNSGQHMEKAVVPTLGCCNKYRGDTRQIIKEIAKDNQIEIVENKPLARMIYHNVDVGAEIPPELYQAVAEVLAYVYRLKNLEG